MIESTFGTLSSEQNPAYSKTISHFLLSDFLTIKDCFHSAYKMDFYMLYRQDVLPFFSIFTVNDFELFSTVARHRSGCKISNFIYFSDPWSFEAVYQEVIKQYGDQGVSSRQLARNQGLLEFLYLPPFNILSLAYFKAIGRDSDSIAIEATKLCRTEKNMERKISCLTHRISAYVESIPKHSNGITLDYRTYCAIAANLFFKSFNSLNIRGARAGFVESSWMLPKALHVVSSVFITNSEGVVFSYVIDVGSMPDILFPLSESAIRWHKNAVNDSQNKFPDLKLL